MPSDSDPVSAPDPARPGGSSVAPPPEPPPPTRRGTGLTRRRLLSGAAFGGAAALLTSGCSTAGDGRKHITWAAELTPVSRRHFAQAAEDFMALHPDVVIEFTNTPAGDLNAWLVTRLAADRAPDIVNMGVSAVGRYTTNGGTVDISRYLPDGYLDQYLPAMRALVEKDGGVYGLPQETNCSLTYFRTDVLDEIGVRPRLDPDDPWTVEEVREIATEARRVTGAYGLSYGYINESSGNRWLPILYMHGGSLFREDGETPAVTDPEAVAALEWTRRLYADGLISASNTVKASQSDTATSLFASRQVGLMVHETQFVTLQESMEPEEWAVDYMFQERATATNLSGNVNVVTRSSRHPDVAAEFLAFACARERTLARLSETGSIPPYLGVTAEEVGYTFRPEVVQRFMDQLETVPPQMAREMAGPDYQAVRQLLGDFLDLMFVGSMSAEETAEALAEGLRNVQT